MKFRKRPIPDDAEEIKCQDFTVSEIVKEGFCALFEYCQSRKPEVCDGIFFKCTRCEKEYPECETAMYCCYDKKYPE